MLYVGFLYLQEVLTQFSKRNGNFWFLANEYLKRRTGKVALVKEFSGSQRHVWPRLSQGTFCWLCERQNMSWWILKRTKWGKGWGDTGISRLIYMHTRFEVTSDLKSVGYKAGSQFRYWTVAQFYWFNSLTSMSLRADNADWTDCSWLQLGLELSWGLVLRLQLSTQGTRSRWYMCSGPLIQKTQFIYQKGISKSSSVKVKSGYTPNVSSDISLTHADTFWEHQCGENQLFPFWFWKALTVF